MMKSRELDVLCFGEALVDFFPTKAGVPLAECELFRRHLGGAPCNVAVGLARLGMKSGLMTLVGRDAFGAFVRAELVSEGVDVASVGVHPTAKTGVTFVAVGASGERSFLFFRHPSADLMIEASSLSAQEVARARVFHFGSSTLTREPARAATRKAIALAKQAGCIISSDPNWRAHLWDDPAEAPAILRHVLGDCDVVKLSDDELEPLVGARDPEVAARRVRSLGGKIVVVTLGARGCYFETPTDRGYVDGVRATVVDTTGAGDAFVAGLLAALGPRLDAAVRGELGQGALAAACQQANAVAASVVGALGATSGLGRRPPPPIG